MRLMLLRHAKSASGEHGMGDIDRPLAPRGKRAAELIGEAMAAHGWMPDLILCSPARRTRETLAGVLPTLTGEARIAIIDALYEPPGDYTSAIAANGGDAERLLLVGHNPAMQATALALIGSGDRDLASEISKKYPTGALAVIDFEMGNWAKIAAKSGRLTAYVTPRSLAKPDEDASDLE
jgi:phosphohistidine phosphatase